MSGRTFAPMRTVLAVVLATTATTAAAQQVVLPPDLGVPYGAGTRPSPGYDLAFALLADGTFAAALDTAKREYDGCMKFGNERWIDSIAAAALVGECHFERGDFDQAVQAYDASLALAALHPNWLLQVRFPPQQLRAFNREAAPWGRSTRPTQLAQVPPEMSIHRPGADAQQVLQQGGVLAGDFNQVMRVQEIMRALTIALYRRAEILGPLGRESPSLDAAARALGRAAPPNHYSQAWTDTALGTALWAQGKPDQAKQFLDRGCTIAGKLDHALTPWGLLVRGRIALDEDQAAAAAQFFEEATYSARDFGDPRALEEAFRLAFAARMLAGPRGAPNAIRLAADAIDPRDHLGVLRSRLLAMQAEALAASGNVPGADAATKAIDRRILNGEPGRGMVGAEAAYADALVALARGDLAAGDAALARALDLARGRSLRLYQTRLLLERVNAGAGASDRKDEALFARLLAPPTPRDFGIDPLATLAVITTPRRPAFEGWFDVVWSGGLGRPADAMLDVAEATRRDQWTTSRPVAGRRVSAERLLSATPDDLAPALAARRAAILQARPELGQLIDGLARKRAALAAAARDAGRAAVDARPPEPADAAESWNAYALDAAGLELSAAALAAGREAVVADFPPLIPTPEIRQRLSERQKILSFHWTARGLTAALEDRNGCTVWDVRKSAGIPAELAQLARGLCLFNPQAPVGTDKLLASEWRASAGRLERLIFENSKVNLAADIDELVIVPDGLLWYLPFELLPVATGRPQAVGADVRPLGEICRVRYCPTRSLAVTHFSAARRDGPVGIHAGHVKRGADGAAVFARVAAAVDRAVPLVLAERGPPGAVAASVFDAVAFFEDAGGAATFLVPPAAGRGGVSFADWLAAPPKRPRIVLAPALQTAMADWLKDPQALPFRAGDDIFLPATDLIAAGARTAVISRWQVSGGTCVDLMAEFLREATAPVDPPEPAAAWRRAIELVTAERPDPEREPRLRQQGDATLRDARHPFLWAGYMLVDCGSGQPPAAAAPPPPAAAPPAVRPAAGAVP